MGSRPASRAGADAGIASAGAAGRPPGAQHRRCGGAGPPGATTPHGAELLRPCRWRGAVRRDRPSGGAPCLAAPSRPRRTPGAPRRLAPDCRRCWLPPNGSPPRWPRVCMAGGVSVRVTVSGSSAASCRAIRSPASTGGSRQSPAAPCRTAGSSARPSGKRRRPSVCGATPLRRCAGARAARRWKNASAPDCCCWRWHRCCCVAASAWR